MTPRKHRKRLYFAPDATPWAVDHPHSESGYTAGENQPCSRTIL